MENIRRSGILLLHSRAIALSMSAKMASMSAMSPSLDSDLESRCARHLKWLVSKILVQKERKGVQYCNGVFGFTHFST